MALSLKLISIKKRNERITSLVVDALAALVGPQRKKFKNNYEYINQDCLKSTGVLTRSCSSCLLRTFTLLQNFISRPLY